MTTDDQSGNTLLTPMEAAGRILGLMHSTADAHGLQGEERRAFFVDCVSAVVGLANSKLPARTKKAADHGEPAAKDLNSPYG